MLLVVLWDKAYNQPNLYRSINDTQSKWPDWTKQPYWAEAAILSSSSYIYISIKNNTYYFFVYYVTAVVQVFNITKHM